MDISLSKHQEILKDRQAWKSKDRQSMGLQRVGPGLATEQEQKSFQPSASNPSSTLVLRELPQFTVDHATGLPIIILKG